MHSRDTTTGFIIAFLIYVHYYYYFIFLKKGSRETE